MSKLEEELEDYAKNLERQAALVKEEDELIASLEGLLVGRRVITLGGPDRGAGKGSEYQIVGLKSGAVHADAAHMRRPRIMGRKVLAGNKLGSQIWECSLFDPKDLLQ